MHVADCKCVTALVIGSIVSLLLADDRLGPSKDVRLQLIDTMLAEYYDQQPGTHRMPPLRLANVTYDRWANLHGPAIKTANTRAAVPAFRGLCHRWFDRGTLSENSVRLVIDALHTTSLRLFTTVGSFGCTRRVSSWVQSTKGFESLLGSQTDVTGTLYPKCTRSCITGTSPA